MELVPVIGLETHIQLSTKSKMFCSCPVASTGQPNEATCPVCLGHPGTLPVLNQEALASAIRLGLALGGTIAPHSKFDRKHYFYPDLPKAYQISQFDLPIMENGALTLCAPGEDPVTIRIERLHLEEDAGKNIHDPSGNTYVDFSRGGIPLCEIVTKPDIRTPAQAKRYVQEMRLLVRTLGVSEGDMESGHLRCDVNISLQEILPGGTRGPLMPKTEIKNINSFKAIERAILFEIERQTALWHAGTPPTITTTRSWNDETGQTDLRREKESSADYRYFPEPDIPPLSLAELTRTLALTLPELPHARRERFIALLGMKANDAEILAEHRVFGDFCDAVLPLLSNLPTETQAKAQTLLPAWILTKLMSVPNAETHLPDPQAFVELLGALAQKNISPAKGLEILTYLVKHAGTYANAVQSVGAETTTSDTLETCIREVMAENPQELARYRAGETKLLAFFLGQVMKKTQGNAQPTEAKALLVSLLA